MADPEPVRAEAAEQSVARALEDAAFAGYAPFGPRLERVALFKGSALLVKFATPPPKEGGERPFLFQKAVVSEYRRLTGESH